MTNNMFDTPPPICSSYPEPPTDDISLLLRQILFKSSSSSSSSSSKQMHYSSSDQIPTAVANIPMAQPHVSSSSVGTIDYDPDEYDCESEDGLEHLMDEMVAKQNPPRNPSKRTRAAEVHNMSEKRRRSKINEKMKALQKLIPNSNKTDKASMLDEAIEYLKQLQLQVQMLTMRNGINLYSMCTPPGVVHPNQNQNQIRTGGLNLGNHEPAVNPMMLSLQNQPSILDFSRAINHDLPFGT